MGTRRTFLKQLGVGAALVAWRPPWASASAGPMCRIVRPGDPDYDAARTDFNQRFDIHPRAILFACSTDDVILGVQYARDNGLELRARSGGHSFEAYSLVEDGLVIDVSQIAHIEVDTKLRRARIGAGAKLGEVYDQLWAAGQLAIPAGSCLSVGLTGLTLGGGFGLLSRERGLTCDTLVAAEMVSANGDLVSVSEKQHQDLFWALQGGGGGNFGIVTELTFRADPIADVAQTSFSWPWEQMPEVMDAWQRWAPGIDRRMVSTVFCGVPGQPVSAFALHNGTPDELQALIEPMLAVGTPTLDVPPYALPWIESVHIVGAGLRSPTIIDGSLRFKGSSAYFYEPLPPEAIATMAENLSNAPGTDLVHFDSGGGAVAEVAPDATAFFHRGALASMQFQAIWNDPADKGAHLAWVEAIREAMLPWTRGAYLNYIDGNIPDWPARYHGDNFDRLREVKSFWDPDNVFHFPLSIPPL